jgi:SAM-dependent methyltransferase
VADTAELMEFYEEGYVRDPSRAAMSSRWRALGAVGKANHVLELCAAAGLAPASTLDVGCGDGALLCELHRRSFGGELAAVEIAASAVAIALARPEIARVALYDGQRLPAGEGEYDLGILSHVLEHVPDPPALLAEVARTCRAVVLEVPLEDNLSARRPSKRGHAEQVGHLQHLSRRATRQIVADAGLHVAGEVEDPLPLGVHRFLAAHQAALDGAPTAGKSAVAAGTATLKWAARSGLHRLAPGAARRLFTVHYACLCLPARVAGPLIERPARAGSLIRESITPAGSPDG